MMFEYFKEKVVTFLESPLISFQEIYKSKIVKLSDDEILFTGQEAEDREVKLVPVNINGGDPQFPERKPKYNKHDAYDMMVKREARLGKYKRRF